MADGLQGLIDQLGGWRRVSTLGVGVGAIALIIAVSRWATSPTWVPVISGAPLESISEVTDRLDQATIPYKLDRGGSDIVVAVTDLPRARVALAKDGLPTGGRPGLEIFDNQALGMTDFTQRVNYRRALEGELFRFVQNAAILSGERNGLRGDYRFSEFSGVTYSPDGKWMFFNIQKPGITVAITGPWQAGSI